MNNSPRNSKDRFVTLLCMVLLACPGQLALAQNSSTITVQADKPGADISPTMYGIFFEDINFGGDGGLYAELIKNRSFEFPEGMMGWIKLSPSLARGELSTEDQKRLMVVGQLFGIDEETPLVPAPTRQIPKARRTKALR